MNQPPAVRPHLVLSAGYWFEGGRKAMRAGDAGACMIRMENAYNHVENALYAEREQSNAMAPLLKKVLMEYYPALDAEMQKAIGKALDSHRAHRSINP